MAHKVKCFYCGKVFDRDKEECGEVNSRRYAHIDCIQKFKDTVKAEEEDRLALNAYIQKIFSGNVNWPLVGKQIKSYKEEYNYTYSGMLKCLKYVYEVKKGDISKAKGVGVIPFSYKDAFNYYYSIWEANQKNTSVQKNYEPKTITLKILSPQRQPYRRNQNLFSFLEEEDTNDV